jgi:hypothetical protein
MKLFEAIKQVDKNAIIVAKDDPKIRMHLLGDLPRNEPSFRATFKPETKNRGKQIQIVFLLESNIKVADMKRDPCMISFLNQDPKTYLNVHEWSSTNIVSIGMITHKLYDATYRMDYQKQLQEFINHAMVNENTTNTGTTKGDDASECTQPASNIPNPDTSSLTPDTTNPNPATNSQDMLRIEISPIMRNHWNLDENGKKTGSPTQSMVLNVKCELQNAERIITLLYDNAKNMDKYKYGLFMSYDHARRNNELYGIMLKKNNEFHHSTQVISVYGLHEEVLHSDQVYDFDNESFYNGYKYLSNYGIVEHYGDVPKTSLVIYSIERTNKSAETGRWLFIVNKDYYHHAIDAITDTMFHWEHIDEFEKHCQDNESFKQGLRFNFNFKDPAEKMQEIRNHAGALLENLSFNDDNSLETTSTTNTKTNKRKKLNSMTFEYSTHDFPEFANTTTTQGKVKENAWKDPLYKKDTNQNSVCSKATSESNSTITTSPSLVEFKAQFDAQMSEMRLYVETKTEEARNNQQTIQQSLLAQNQQMLHYQELINEQEKRHQLQIAQMDGKLDELKMQVTILLQALGVKNLPTAEAPSELTTMDITPKGKQQESNSHSTPFIPKIVTNLFGGRSTDNASKSLQDDTIVNTTYGGTMHYDAFRSPPVRVAYQKLRCATIHHFKSLPTVIIHQYNSTPTHHWIPLTTQAIHPTTYLTTTTYKSQPLITQHTHI